MSLCKLRLYVSTIQLHENFSSNFLCDYKIASSQRLHLKRKSAKLLQQENQEKWGGWPCISLTALLEIAMKGCPCKDRDLLCYACKQSVLSKFNFIVCSARVLEFTDTTEEVTELDDFLENYVL